MCRGGRFSSEAPAEEHHLPTFQGFLLIRDWVTRDLSHFVLPWPREVMCPSHTLKYQGRVSDQVGAIKTGAFDRKALERNQRSERVAERV